MTNTTIIGRLTAATVESLSFQCLDGQPMRIQLGCLVRAEIQPGMEVYGVIAGIDWNGDGLASVVAGQEDPDPSIVNEMMDRSGSPVINCQYVGYTVDGEIIQTLPPRPPAALHAIHLCTPEEILAFTRRVGYLRLLTSPEAGYPIADIVSNHVYQAFAAQRAGGNQSWIHLALREIVALLRTESSLLRATTWALSEQIAIEETA